MLKKSHVIVDKEKRRRASRQNKGSQPPVGSTVATGIGSLLQQHFVTDQNIKPIGLDKLISKTMDNVVSVVPGLNPAGKVIVESLVWCFAARRSLRELPFTEVEFGRFRLSIIKTAEVISEYQTDDCREQSFVKYWIDYFLAAGFEDDQKPVREEWMKKQLFHGWCRRFVVRAIAKRDLSFLYSLQKGSKQMWPPLKEENMRKAIIKSISNLCTSARKSDPNCLKAIIKVSKDIFANISWKETDLGNRFMPSSSACLQAPLKDGGALSLFKPIESPDRELVDTLGYLRAVNLEVDAWRQETFDTAIKQVSERLLYDVNASYDSEVKGVEKFMRGDGNRGSSRFGLFDVVYVGLFEPGKIRGISKGDGFLATALQPLQGKLLSAWKNTPWSTMKENDLLDSINLMDTMVPEEYWCSGDYEAATDKLHKDASIAALSAVPDHPLKSLGILSFQHGRITYVEPTLENFQKKPAERSFISYPLLNGQLMGHTLSFPLLCVINLAVLWETLQIWINDGLAISLGEKISRGRRAELIYKYAKINGDDVLFKGPFELFSIHRKVAESVGFKISQGKNYISKHSCLINSQLYTRKGNAMVRIGYLNLRLVKGNNIKGSIRTASDDRMSVDPTHIGKELNKMAKLAPWTASAIPTAFKRWESKLRDFKWFTPNWYLPVHLGGYGIDLQYAPQDLMVTRNQRLLAAMFVNEPELLLFRRDGVIIPKKFKSKIVGTFTIEKGSFNGPLPSHIKNVSDIDGTWLERLAYAERCNYKNVLNQVDSTDDLEMFIKANSMKRNKFYKPLSINGLIDYWTIQVHQNQSSEPPPLAPIKLSQDSSVQSMIYSLFLLL